MIVLSILIALVFAVAFVACLWAIVAFMTACGQSLEEFVKYPSGAVMRRRYALDAAFSFFVAIIAGIAASALLYRIFSIVGEWW